MSTKPTADPLQLFAEWFGNSITANIRAQRGLIPSQIKTPAQASAVLLIHSVTRTGAPASPRRGDPPRSPGA